MPFDKIKNQRKGFGFITFESDQVVNDLLKRPKQTIKGKEVDVKRPKPKPDQMGPMMMGRGGQDWNQTYGGGFDGYSQGYDYSGYGGYGGQDYSNYGGYGSGHRGGIRGVRGGQRQQRRQPY
ncbi:unnamed protein product [Acanthoscelides obtectus]|uniref:RRM domain-containing protein n=1 Tax=Acanthoscelides obtectus TaxID=200917 RepID=A0A9P0L3D8_ACAOB|nr:unnamed protein product [Acanthoscelides obtectus]CAK1672482.1 RNA-binding protein squid [Acanthoscelides obtectus]